MFKQNESQNDRIVRIVIGLLMLFGGLFLVTGGLKLVMLVLGAVALFTGVTGFCAIYKLLGMATNKK